MCCFVVCIVITFDNIFLKTQFRSKKPGSRFNWLTTERKLLSSVHRRVRGMGYFELIKIKCKIPLDSFVTVHDLQSKQTICARLQYCHIGPCIKFTHVHFSSFNWSEHQFRCIFRFRSRVKTFAICNELYSHVYLENNRAHLKKATPRYLLVLKTRPKLGIWSFSRSFYQFTSILDINFYPPKVCCSEHAYVQYPLQ